MWLYSSEFFFFPISIALQHSAVFQQKHGSDNECSVNHCVSFVFIIIIIIIIIIYLFFFNIFISIQAYVISKDKAKN